MGLRVKITVRQPHTSLPLINMNPIKFFRSSALYMLSRTALTQNPWDLTDARLPNIPNYLTVIKFYGQPSENVYLSVTSFHPKKTSIFQLS
jgi:hypothetical protein